MRKFLWRAHRLLTCYIPATASEGYRGHVMWSTIQSRMSENSGEIAAMSDVIGFAQADERILVYEVSDETLEAAAGSKRVASYTLFFCTALDMCPGP
jgi:hypothetical protein